MLDEVSSLNTSLNSSSDFFFFHRAKYFFILFIYLFNSLFTVDVSIVVTTNLHGLTENFIIERKI